MKKPTAASLKKVTPENLARLGPERLAELLCAAAETKPELKRRLRMELAAEQGAEHLTPEIDRRLASLATSRSKVSWRQRPSFVRDLDGLRGLIADKLAALDPAAAQERMWGLMAAARRVGSRVNDRHGELAAVFVRAAGDLGALLAHGRAEAGGAALAMALTDNLHGWSAWLPALLQDAPPGVAAAALRHIAQERQGYAAWTPLIRSLADAAGDADAYAATYTATALKDPAVAALVGARLLAAGRIAEAGVALTGAKRGPDVDPDWESAWIDWLEASGDAGGAQAARWAAFERTLSPERARAFIARLADFDDVEAEQRAFAFARAHEDFGRGLGFLMAWPALSEAARMIEAREGDVEIGPPEAEAWAAQLQTRHPAAAHRLLRRAAAAAFRRRDFKTCDRLTAEADAIGV